MGIVEIGLILFTLLALVLVLKHLLVKNKNGDYSSFLSLLHREQSARIEEEEKESWDRFSDVE